MWNYNAPSGPPMNRSRGSYSNRRPRGRGQYFSRGPRRGYARQIVGNDNPRQHIENSNRPYYNRNSNVIEPSNSNRNREFINEDPEEEYCVEELYESIDENAQEEQSEYYNQHSIPNNPSLTAIDTGSTSHKLSNVDHSHHSNKAQHGYSNIVSDFVNDQPSCLKDSSNNMGPSSLGSGDHVS